MLFRSLETKIDLLIERKNLAAKYKDITNIENYRWLYMGSAIMSCFQLCFLSARNLKSYRHFHTYTQIPEVRKCIKSAKKIKGGVVRNLIPFYLLNYNLTFTLFLICFILRKFGVKSGYE